MYNLDILDPDGYVVKTFLIPEGLHEIPVWRYLEFEEKVLTLAPDEDSTPEDELRFDMEVVKFWGNLDEEDLQNIKLRELRRIAGLCVNATKTEFLSYKPIDSFKVDGETFYLPDRKEGILDRTIHNFNTVTVGEYATAQELRKAFTMMGSGYIRGVLSMIAVLCRKKGESMPLGGIEQTDFIRHRMEFLEMMDCATALNVAFFLMRENEQFRAYFLAFAMMGEVASSAINTAGTLS